MNLESQRQLGHYKIISPLGAGGMGTVFWLMTPNSHIGLPLYQELLLCVGFTAFESQRT